MKQYYERRITYNPETQNYHVTIPELGLEVQSDTESSGLVAIREELAEYARKPLPPPKYYTDSVVTTWIDPKGSGTYSVTLPKDAVINDDGSITLIK